MLPPFLFGNADCLCHLCVRTLWVFSTICLRPFPGEKSGSVPWIISVLLLAIAAAIVLCLFDYVSLLETRFVLRLLQRWSSWKSVLILLWVDVVVTGVIGGIPVDLALGVTLHPFQTISQSLADDEASSVQFKKTLEQERAQILSRNLLKNVS